MSDEWIMIKENRGDGSKSGPPKPTPNPLSLMERTNDTHDNESFESFESRFPVLHWDWESNPHQPGTWIGADPSSPTANDTNPLSDSVHDTRTLAKQYLTAAPIHAYPPPRRPTTTPNCGAWERLTTPPAPASPRLTTALPPSPQAVSPSPATKLPTPKPKPKRSPTLPGSYTSWMRDLEQPDPPPPTPAEDSPFQYPHTGVHVHPPQVPFSETYLPTYAQPPPGNTHPAEAHVHDLVASFEAMTVGELDNLAPSPIHPPPHISFQQHFSMGFAGPRTLLALSLPLANARTAINPHISLALSFLPNALAWPPQHPPPSQHQAF
ncbi:uncharacterized protein CcaverHIS019_0700610 [Cutaneotrichosporon cavernicola]|uniref:Uncharacterized protein n=1 Tax=Cutaneotrichosporon cavernicola TaxID=279322 RepID=A0AA48L9I1_9TREE|nr:uncharacterized protein CcaverHIS019_0700610 [Cutaneotrichosporon cavernicola]BEI94489.1 hypothetical protein CcaverHIS019_0700610 [Cutaneotrichosporon cavernicola]